MGEVTKILIDNSSQAEILFLAAFKKMGYDQKQLKEPTKPLLTVLKCIYLPPTYLHFIQDIEDRCLLLMSSMSFVDLPFQEHRMMKKNHMNQNPCISSFCPK
jgi:hypothetical protein